MTDEEHLDADGDLGFAPAVVDDTGRGKDARPKAATAAPRRRRGGLRRRASSLAVLIGALTAVGGGYAMIAPSSGADDSIMTSENIEAGRQLFNNSCITCHGANLEGVPGRGPTIVGTGSASVYFQVSTGRMPAPVQGAWELRKIPKFNEQETLQLAAFVQSVGGGPQLPAATENLRAGPEALGEGGELFRLNCASCHGAAGKGAPLSAGKIAPDLNLSTDLQMYTAMQSGPENMPVFANNQITPEQKRAIIGYVQAMKESKDPGGASLGRIGPVAEGLLIWTVGLGVLMVSILWIGARL
ncbi:MAG TPA: c-type cytochrome [Jatrophihabitans sp.]|jgi:ubiquinol-cytochrome c reductase cytochrome c subunit|uniref:cytochrome bc1 complex diheme cytochrome c subunit n=1 Tax=Jatrophihabitans sp. TaxID=1932789 RepID=UPI002EF28211